MSLRVVPKSCHHNRQGTWASGSDGGEKGVGVEGRAREAAQGGNCTLTCGDKRECRANECGCIPGYSSIGGTTCAETEQDEYFERHPEDGWFNNLIHPDWGAIDGDLLRRSPAAYSDGVYEPSGVDRPNPFDISDAAHNGSAGQGSGMGRTAMLVFFGQQLVEEIMDAQRPGCPREFINIPVPKGHPYNPDNLDNLQMPFLRTRYNQRTGHSPNNPRQQLNEITPFIDGNLMYGAGKAVADAVRAFDGTGRLAARNNLAPINESLPKENDIRLPMANPPSPRDDVLRPVSRFPRLGNPRGNENPFLLTFGVLWFRYHNWWADRLRVLHPNWNGERLFDEAKKRVIGQYQKLVWYDWLPAWLGTHFDVRAYPYIAQPKNGSMDPNATESLNPYSGYDPNVHPGISQEFQAAALRFGHTLVPSGVFTRTNDRSCSATASKIQNGPSADHTGVRLCNAFWVSQESVEDAVVGIDGLLLGMAWTRSEKEDRIIVSDLRQEVFGPLDWTRRDLAALNIQRGRDHGLPGYNDVREAYGLKRLTWDELEALAVNESAQFKADLKDSIENLKKLDGLSDSPDSLDVFPGGLLETTTSGPGPLFQKITIDQFLRIRTWGPLLVRKQGQRIVY
ncbi:hypothetical protein BaRGS_00019492 [Batillaria attramentaria]|uniref:Uncharacterized protein n=1 Tax=Batillaria attramentaria TaxID=370345 RepID=A0ABD0KPR0_9CAEN